MVRIDLYFAVFSDRLISIFNDIDQDLFELDTVHMNILVFFCEG